MLELRRFGHASVDFAIVVVRDRHPFETLGQNALAEALHSPVEQDLFDAPLPRESELAVAIGRQAALQVLVAFLRRLSHTDQHLPQSTQSVLRAQNVEGQVLGMDAVAVSCPSDVVLGQRCPDLLRFLL